MSSAPDIKLSLKYTKCIKKIGLHYQNGELPRIENYQQMLPGYVTLSVISCAYIQLYKNSARMLLRVF